ncbi:MAG: carboxypeptidase-like regulatory domain-containing protein [Saprospiraceae bacterium]
MKYLFIVLTFTAFSFKMTAQINGKVIDAKTNEAIIYTNIWIENQQIGTTTNEDGFFKFDELSDTLTLVFSALGYETKHLKVNDLSTAIALEPIAIELETVTVLSPNFRKEKRTGKIRKKGIDFWFGASKSPWRIGKIFPYDEEYEESPFIKKIDLCVNAHERNRQILIHILEVGEGTPDNWEILEQNILHTIPKSGENITTIDLESYQVKMQKSGVMIVVEWLIIENNRYEYEYTDWKTEEKKLGLRYEPSVGTVPVETTENIWQYSRGSWRRDYRKSGTQLKKYDNKYTELAMELILSD